MENYKERLKVRQYDLDSEWVSHPVNVDEINRDYVEASLKKKRAERYLEVVESNLFLTARSGKNPDPTDDHPIPYTERLDVLPDKPTVEAIKSWIRVHPRYTEAQEELFKAEHEVGILMSGTKAFSAKGDSLKDLTKLCLADRYSYPSSPPEVELQNKGVETGTGVTSDRLETSGRLRKKLVK